MNPKNDILTKNIASAQSWIHTLVLALLAFMLLYNISFNVSENLTTGRLAVLLMGAWVFFTQKAPFQLLKSKIWMLFLPLPYVLTQYLLIGDYGQSSRFINLALYAYLGAAFFALLATDVKTTLKAILIAITTQSFILFYSFFNFEYRIWFDSIAQIGANYSIVTNLYRAPGFTSAAGASLSLIQSLGVLVGWLLLRKNDTFWQVEGVARAVVFYSMTLCMISCVLVGRTGIVMSSLFMLLFCFSVGIRSMAAYSLPIVPIAFYFMYDQSSLTALLANNLSDSFSTEYFFDWAFGFLSGNDRTLESMFEMPIAPLSLEAMHGTGLVSLAEGVNPSGHDSGFIQAYYSMGLPMTLVLYGAYFLVLRRVFNWASPSLRFVLVLTFFLIETKEPFLFKYSTLFVLLAVHFAHVLSSRRPTNVETATEAETVTSASSIESVRI